MIDKVVNMIFNLDSLRTAVFAEVDLYNSVTRIMADDESSKVACAVWCDEDGWRGWKIKEDGTYYFHDIAEHSLGNIMNEVMS
jgi:hypothetical protein